MLVLTRNQGQQIVIGNNITITVLDIRDGRTRIGIDAPRDVPVHRKEIADLIERNGFRDKKIGED